MQKIFTLSRNARAISGSDVRNSPQSKNVRRTSGQPGACVISDGRATREEDDRAGERDQRRRGGRRRRHHAAEDLRAAVSQVATSGPARRSPSLATAAGSAAACRSPSASRARRSTQRGERVALREDHAEVLAAGSARELAEDLRVRHLGGGDVERGRQVDDEPVDLLVLQRLRPRRRSVGRRPAASTA